MPSLNYKTLFILSSGILRDLLLRVNHLESDSSSQINGQQVRGVNTLVQKER